MAIEGLERTLLEHPFFKGLAPDHGKLIVGCAKNVRFEAGDYLLREGEPADWFYLVRHGRVALELKSPGRAPVTIQTIREGEVAGVSWLIPPYRWTYDARAMELTRALALDAKCLRGKCEEDHHLGYDLMKRFMPVLIQRLQATRLQLLDLYGAAV